MGEISSTSEARRGGAKKGAEDKLTPFLQKKMKRSPLKMMGGGMTENQRDARGGVVKKKRKIQGAVRLNDAKYVVSDK